MTKPNDAFYDYIVRELAPTEYEQDEAPITIVCEPLGVPGGRVRAAPHHPCV